MKVAQIQTTKQCVEAIRLAVLDSQGNLDVLDEQVKQITANGLPGDATGWKDLFQNALQGINPDLTNQVYRDYLLESENNGPGSHISNLSGSLASAQLLHGRYQIIQSLGQGGFSQTYIARDTGLSGYPKCVVKHLKPTGFDSTSLELSRRLFKAEAEVLEQLEHPQIPRLLAYFEQDQEFYLVQELIEGQPLSQELVPAQRWAEERVIDLLVEFLSILDFLHRRKIIHCDIKPENLIRCSQDQKLVLIDFGSATPVQLLQIDKAVAVISEGYSPIEQLEGKPEPSSDIYALGKIAIQALTGSHPKEFAEDSDTGEIIWQHLTEASDGLAAVLTKMVRSHSEDRYQTVAEVIQALQLSNAPSPITPPINSPIYTPTKVVPLQQAPKAALVSPLKPAFPQKQPTGIQPEQDLFAELPSTLLPASDSGHKTDIQPLAQRIKIFFTPKRISLLVGSGLFVTGVAIVFISMVGATKGFGLHSTKPHSSHISVPASPTQKFLVQTLTAQSALIRSVAFSPDGQTLIGGGEDNLVKVWDLKTGSQVQTLADHAGSITSVALSSNGRLLASSSEDSTIDLWDAHTGRLLHTLRGHLWPVLSIAISPDGQILASGSEDHTIKLWNLKTKQLLKTLSGYTAAFSSVAISSDGWFLVAGSADNTIRVWDLHSGQLKWVLRGHSGKVSTVAISPDNATLASTSADGSIKLWNLYTGKLLRSLEGHNGAVHAIAISADGQTLASGGEDSKINLWNLRTGERLHTFDEHLDPIYSVAFSPSGKTLASSSLDKTIRIWQVP
ncbi:serine/threonine-protein kinase [Leptolyngbya sp. FACHB-261]|uniref:serine/threonine-protein kinase n=1 Tax=Leptolyngbya sp. FACHB-261 TaxID=2692806 RepID=UPI001683010A|nr:serine/threonine-protein kinase [Leptolyngbya sp. FACHB-261]MBD2103978.1 serine/threonine protein kinase [Leptolyngbya sp. FACHB-261]